MRYSISVRTTREVVVDAKNERSAATKARIYAKDCLPCLSGCLDLGPPTVKPDDHTSRTSDDEFDIPRDV